VEPTLFHKVCKLKFSLSIWLQLPSVRRATLERRSKMTSFPVSEFLKTLLALMFLNHYACCLDERLIEQLNANVHYKIFCDLLLSLAEAVGNFKLVSQIRCELASKLDIAKSQQCPASSWLAYMDNPSHATRDATCYESEMRIPINQKLLWECIDWMHGQIQIICKYLKIRMPRTRFLK